MMKSEPQTLRDLLGVVSSDVHLLATQTLRLARLELSSAATSLAWSAVGIVSGLLVALAGAAVLVSALVLIAVAVGLPAWAAALLVGLILTIGGAVTAYFFVDNARHVSFGMNETRESLQETLEWLNLQSRK